jgi:type I restriction enzyme S subunit
MSSSDEAGWSRVRLGECCEEVADRIDEPSQSGYERFVGLEHLDSGETIIRRWGSTADVTSSMKIFKRDDIIVARRNVYLRRAALAEFDGVCSGDGIVLRPTGRGCHTGLLPFLLNSDGFWDYVCSQADGSMSKRITVRRLLAYTFDVPSTEEQLRIVDACVAAQDLSSRYLSLATSSVLLLQSSIDAAFDGFEENLVSVGTLVDKGILASPQDGNHGEIHPKAADYVASGVPFLMASDVRDGNVELEGCHFLPKQITDKLRTGFAHEGDVLLTHKGTLGETAILGPLETDYAMLTPQVTYYRVIDRNYLLPRYLYFMFRSSRFQREMLSYGRQSTRAYVGIKKQHDLSVPVPTPEMQEHSAQIWDEIEAAQRMAIRRGRESNRIAGEIIREGLTEVGKR